MHFISLPFAFSELSGGLLVAIAVPVAVFLVGGAIAICALYFQHQQKTLWHETARLALEKGQPLPAMEERKDPVQSRRPSHHSDFRAGLILIAVGVGLYLFLNNIAGDNHGVGMVGAIPGFIGVALLIFGTFNALFSRRKSIPEDRPRQS